MHYKFTFSMLQLHWHQDILYPLFHFISVYRVREDVVQSIRCHSMKGSPTEPQSYVEHIEESEADRLGFREVNQQ